MRPKAEIARLRARVAVLEGQLAAAGIEVRTVVDAPQWAAGLSRQEQVLMGALIAAYPRLLDAWAIDAALPHQDHAADRDLRLAATLVCAVRRKLGADAIETVWGEGYRAGAKFRARGACSAAPSPLPIT